jgi:hypothetical protein
MEMFLLNDGMNCFREFFGWKRREFVVGMQYRRLGIFPPPLTLRVFPSSQRRGN